MQCRKATLTFLVAVVLNGCTNHTDTCVQFLEESDLQDVLLVREIDSRDVPQICERRPFQSIDRVELNHAVLVSCHDLCANEFTGLMGSLGTLAVLEEDLCESMHTDWQLDASHPTFMEFFDEFFYRTLRLDKCIHEFLIEN